MPEEERGTVITGETYRRLQREKKKLEKEVKSLRAQAREGQMEGRKSICCRIAVVVAVIVEKEENKRKAKL